MAGYGKNSRGGKRGSSSSSSSSSSYFSTTTMLLVLVCCVFAVYMLTSSSITPPHATPASSNLSHHHHKRNAIPTPPRSILRDPQPADEVREDTQGDLPVEAVKGHHESISSKNQEEVTSDSAGTEEDSRSEVEAVQHEKQQQEDVETNPEKPLQEEEVETRRNDEEVPHDDQPDAVNEQQQQEEQEQQPVRDDQAQEQPQQQQDQNQEEEQQQNGAVNGQSNEEQQQHIENEEQQQQSSEHNSEEHEQQQQHDEEQSNDESQQQQQSETNGEEGHPDETGNNESQQQSVDEIDDNQSKNLPQIIEQVTEGSNSQSEGGEGISSGSQIEHDTDGTTEHQQQQQEEEQQQQRQQEEEEQQQQQQQEQQQQQDSTQPQQTEDESSTGGGNENNQQPNEDSLNVNDSLPEGGQSDVEIENKGDKKTWATQADQSSNEKERRKGEESSESNEGGGEEEEGNADAGKSAAGRDWKLCNVTAGPDYIPCLDNEKAIKQLRSFRHFEHRERHCPEEGPTCLVPLPKGYRPSIQWPQSRDRIWYNNVPRTKLAEVKGHQNWVKVTGEYLTFPGGGTQFIHGALHYIDFIQQSVPEIAWGKHTRVILDVGCGVASFGGYLFERDVLAMSFAPKDEHEAQVQFALERGIPAISAVMGSQRLPFPSRVFDIVHCARCRVPWHANDGALLLELNRVLRPGGFFVWSATPVYQKLKEDVEIWEAMSALTKSMCWELITIKRDKLNSVGAAMYRKPVTNDCYENRNEQKPPMCKEDDDPNAAWYVPLQSCMHRVPVDPPVRGSKWPLEWPRRVQVPPYWLNSSQIGVYGRPAPDDFTKDYEHWKRVVNKSYLNGFGIDWSRVRNVMDMRAVYGGFAAALKDMKVWVMNLVNIDSPDTLPIIYERGLFGMYHDWCESFSTYPRTYDLLHADHLFSQVRKRCKVLAVVAEVDRITRPGGKLIVRDESDAVSEVENLLRSLHWEIRLTYSRNNEGILCAEKTDWRPEKIAAPSA